MCPAAHTRIASPAHATASPSVHEVQVGRATITAITAVTKPNPTRRRASCARRPPHALSTCPTQASGNGGGYFVHADLLDARRPSAALPLIQAHAALGARHHHVG